MAEIPAGASSPGKLPPSEAQNPKVAAHARPVARVTQRPVSPVVPPKKEKP